MHTPSSLFRTAAATLFFFAASRAAFAADQPKTRTFEFTYTAEVLEIPADATEIAIWIPYPQSDAWQRISKVEVEAPGPTRVTREREFGNQTLYFSLRPPKSPALTVELRFQAERRELVRRDPASARNEPAADHTQHARWLQPDRLVPIDGKVRDLAREVTRGKTTDLERARAIYDYTVDNLKYDKTGTGWGRGDILFACDAKRGNCTDFHAVFIGLCRAMGIPARFEIGFPLPADRSEGEIAGYHCWAEFYLKDRGWVPVDASEARKQPLLREYYFGAHDEHRVLFTQGRDLRLDPPQTGDPLNYLIYPHVEVNGKPHAAVRRSFRFKDIKTTP